MIFKCIYDQNEIQPIFSFNFFFLDHGSHIHKSPDAGEKSHAQPDSSEEHLNIGILKHHVSNV